MPKTSEPTLKRRHVETCEHYGKLSLDRGACRCPFYLDMRVDGKRQRVALKTGSRQIAERKMRAHLSEVDGNHALPSPAGIVAKGAGVADAVAAFLRHQGSIGPDGKYVKNAVEFSTFRKYRNTLQQFAAYCVRAGVAALKSLDADGIEAYRESRMTDPDPRARISPVTWSKELELLRGFLKFCGRRHWISGNPAKDVDGPRNLKENEVTPYTEGDQQRILAACDLIGGTLYSRAGATYERLRARAMVLTLRYTALRISDVAMLRTDAITRDAKTKAWMLYVRTLKSGARVFVPIPADLKFALDALPAPRNAPADCEYLFCTGLNKRSATGVAERTLSAVFRRSGVVDAGAHRYRHTLATRMLADGHSLELVADILGNSPEVVRKHYGKWAEGRQQNINTAMTDYHRKLTEAGTGTDPITSPDPVWTQRDLTAVKQ
jgi:site-specific recombinase XerD